METEWTSSTPSHFIAIETGARHCQYMLISKMRETDCLAMKLLDHTWAVFSRAVFQVAQRVTSGSPVKTVVF